jgi:hypothetical protein
VSLWNAGPVQVVQPARPARCFVQPGR